MTAARSPKAAALRRREQRIIEKAVRSVTTLEQLHKRPTLVRGTVLLGYHHRVQEQDLTHEQAVQLLLSNLERVTTRLRPLIAKLSTLGEPRVAVILHLGLVLTPEKLESMKEFWSALRAGNFEKAGEEAMLSEWPALVGTDEYSRRRVIVLDRVLRHGKWPDQIPDLKRRS